MSHFIYKLTNGELSKYHPTRFLAEQNRKFFRLKYKNLKIDRELTDTGQVGPREYCGVCNLGLKAKGKLLI